MILIPAIDLKGGKCVRLRQGRMSEATEYSDDPVTMAGQWIDQGAQRLHLVDLDGAFAGEPKHAEVIARISAKYPHIEIQVGGGIRNLQTIQTYLDAGVNYVIIGTQAVKDPNFVAAACEKYPGHVIVGIDAKNGLVALEGWAEGSDLTAIALAQKFEGLGVSAIVYTDISRDGMLSGVNVDATAELARGIAIPVIASGGVASIDDIRKLLLHRESGVAGSILGKALYEQTLDLAEALALAGAGV